MISDNIYHRQKRKRNKVNWDTCLHVQSEKSNPTLRIVTHVELDNSDRTVGVILTNEGQLAPIHPGFGFGDITYVSMENIYPKKLYTFLFRQCWHLNKDNVAYGCQRYVLHTNEWTNIPRKHDRFQGYCRLSRMRTRYSPAYPSPGCFTSDLPVWQISRQPTMLVGLHAKENSISMRKAPTVWWHL